MQAVAHVPGATEARLLDLVSQADALATYLAVSPAAVAHLIERRRSGLREATGELVGVLHGLLELSSEAKAAVRSTAEALVAVLAPGGATSGGGLARHRARVAEACVELDGEVSAAFSGGLRPDAATSRALRRFQRSRRALEGDLGIADACRRLTSGCRGRELAERRREIVEQVEALKALLEERHEQFREQRRRSARRWREVDASLRDGVEEVGAALERLLR